MVLIGLQGFFFPNGHRVGQFVRGMLTEALKFYERGLAHAKESLDNLCFPLMGRLKLDCFEGEEAICTLSFQQSVQMVLCRYKLFCLGCFCMQTYDQQHQNAAQTSPSRSTWICSQIALEPDSIAASRTVHALHMRSLS